MRRIPTMSNDRFFYTEGDAQAQDEAQTNN